MRLTISRLKLATLQSRFAEAIALAEEALAGLEGLADRDELEIDIYNNYGHALIMAGQHDRGCRVLREAIEHARRDERLDAMGISYVNLADALHLRGRGREASDVVAEALAGPSGSPHVG